MKPDPEFQRRWLAALRGEVTRPNGEPYRQGRRQLRAADLFCCQGVACDLVDPEAWSHEIWEYSAGGWASLNWPGWVGERLGLTEDEGDELAAANDDGASFAEIADMAERMMGLAL